MVPPLVGRPRPGAARRPADGGAGRAGRARCAWSMGGGSRRTRGFQTCSADRPGFVSGTQAVGPGAMLWKAWPGRRDPNREGRCAGVAPPGAPGGDSATDSRGKGSVNPGGSFREPGRRMRGGSRGDPELPGRVTLGVAGSIAASPRARCAARCAGGAPAVRRGVILQRIAKEQVAAISAVRFGNRRVLVRVGRGRDRGDELKSRAGTGRGPTFSLGISGRERHEIRDRSAGDGGGAGTM
jgi:hypothetical protein